MNKPKVSACIITYNQESFIRKCLEGAVSQVVNFDYEIIIGDDCSSDNTKQICIEYSTKYPNLIKYTKRNNNLGMIGNWIATISECEGKYIALCEGDDYWTDPYKLQKQVDFLEANPDYSICWTKYKVLKQSEKDLVIEEPDWISNINSGKNFHIDLNNVFTPYCTMTLTCMFKSETLDLSVFKKMKYSKDNTLYALCLSKGSGMLLNFYGAVYRLHNGGIYSNASVFKQKYLSYLNINEIIDVITVCNNENIRTVRNYLLIDTLIYLPRKKLLKYFHLLWDSFFCFGVLKAIIIINKKIKGESFSRKSIG